MQLALVLLVAVSLIAAEGKKHVRGDDRDREMGSDDYRRHHFGRSPKRAPKLHKATEPNKDDMTELAQIYANEKAEKHNHIVNVGDRADQKPKDLTSAIE